MNTQRDQFFKRIPHHDLQQVNYVIHGLNKRMEEAKSAWLVTLKTLIVYHRLMREVDPSLQVGCPAMQSHQAAIQFGCRRALVSI